MNQIAHIAIQIVPIKASGDLYAIIDKAIALIDQSGYRYEVGPMETVIEGPYREVMNLVEQAQRLCLDEGADELVVTMKVHIRKNGNVTWDEKMEKYRK